MVVFYKEKHIVANRLRHAGEPVVFSDDFKQSCCARHPAAADSAGQQQQQ